MTTYIAQMPCRFGGNDYKPGDEIPEGKVLPKMVGELRSMGYIIPAPVIEAEPASIEAAEEKAAAKKTKTAKAAGKK